MTIRNAAKMPDDEINDLVKKLAKACKLAGCSLEIDSMYPGNEVVLVIKNAYLVDKSRIVVGKGSNHGKDNRI